MKFTGFLVWIFYFMVFWSSVDAEFFDELPKILKQKCAVLIFEPVSNELQSVIEKLIALEPLASEIFFDSIQLKTLISQKFLHFKSGISGISDHSKPGVSGISDPGQDPEKSKSEFLVLPKVLEDRSCLLKPNLRHLNLKAEFYNGPITVESVLEFINAHCLTYFAPDGSLSFSGQKRNFLLANLFEISQLNNSVKMEEISENCGPDLAGFWFSGCCETSEFRNPKISKFKNQEYAEFKNPEISEFQCAKFEIPRCEEIWQIPTKQEFLDNFLSRSKPVVIRNAAADWRILKIWTNEFFRRKFGDREVHVKLTPNGEFEGVEPLALWNYDGFHIPNEVKNQLKFSDLVMARPAGLEMRFSEFLDFIESPKKNFSAYLEYSTIKEYFAELLEEVSEFPFIKGLLKLDYLNIWLSDGNTLGKLHFDQYDNFLVQLSGRKQVILFDPRHNVDFYEGHILEAMFSFENGKFKRDTLMENTAMTMLPVDIVRPDFERFPNFAHTFPMNCTINAGDVLFMPSFFLHEVQSFPDGHEKRNLAINFWYDPFFTKPFPCAECPMDINPNYRHLL